MCRGQRSVVEQPDQTTQSLHAPPAADPQSHNSAEEQVVFFTSLCDVFWWIPACFFYAFSPSSLLLA